MTPQLPRTHGSSFFAEMHHVIMKIMCGKKKGKGITMKKHIYILATGGTIAGKAASEAATTGYEAGAIGIADLLAAVSEVRQYADVEGEQIASIDSKDMTSAIWLRLAARCKELLAREDVDGVVITHGTDTMEETAYFLHLTVHSAKPIVLTGAMRPATALSADGPMNLLQAVRVAAADEAVGQGVLIVLDGTIESARDAVKMHTTALDTFQSPEVGALGSVHDGEPVFYRSPLRRHTTRSAFSVEGVPELPRVAVLYAHADDDGFLVEAAVQSGCRGIVYAGMGNGSIPARAEAALARAAAEGVVVVRSTRSAAGRVTRAEASYETNGFIASDTLNPAKARVLLQLTLLQTDDTAAIRKMFKIY